MPKLILVPLGGNPDRPSRPLVKTTALVNLAPQRVMQDGLLRRSGGATSRSTRPVQASSTS